jgi:hypothetical protein
VINKFKFEEETFSGIVSFPLSTQFRLDSIGVQIHPETWNKLSPKTRRLFSYFSVKTTEDKERYRMYILFLMKHLRRPVSLLEAGQVDRARAEWENLTRIPIAVYQMVVNLDYTLSPRDWIKMSDFKRYALVKLSQGEFPKDYLDKALVELLPVESKIKVRKSKLKDCSGISRQLISA